MRVRAGELESVRPQKTEQTAVTFPHHTSRTPPLPPLFLICSIAASALMEYFVPLPFRPASTFFKLVPLLLLGSATGLVGSALIIMQRKDTPLHPLDTPRTLVTGGPFRLTRNPIYLGLLFVLAAVGLVFDSLWFLLAVPVLLLLLNTLVIPREERALSAGFGAEYEEYRHRVRRWL